MYVLSQLNSTFDLKCILDENLLFLLHLFKFLAKTNQPTMIMMYVRPDNSERVTVYCSQIVSSKKAKDDIYNLTYFAKTMICRLVLFSLPCLTSHNPDVPTPPPQN